MKFDTPKILFLIFVGAWIFWAIDPVYRFDWFLENLVIFFGIPLVIWSYCRFRLSARSYFLIFIFAILHIAAAHYTYGETPWGDLASALLGWERNHYDRVVHFLFGVLMTPVAWELVSRYATDTGRLFRGIAVFSIIFAIGSLYEVAEFVVGILVKPEAGLAFLGFQGDIWDTQKDMALQGLGALFGMFLAKK